jgi:hypothetical protein
MGWILFNYALAESLANFLIALIEPNVDFFTVDVNYSSQQWSIKIIIYLLKLLCAKFINLKEGPLTKNGPIDFAQIWSIHIEKSN